MSIKKVNSTENVETKGIVSIELSKIVTGDFNPRKSVNENELTDSTTPKEPFPMLDTSKTALCTLRSRLFLLVQFRM
jgi:hypothetical protein